MSVLLLKGLIIIVMLGIVVAAFFTMMLMLTGQFNFWLLLVVLILEIAAQIWLRGVYDRLPGIWG